MRILSFILLVLLPLPCLALTPSQVLVIANAQVLHSIELARYYMEKRNIPAGNLVEVRVTDQETCSRLEYEEKVAGPIRRALAARGPSTQIRCLVTMYGVPLKVAQEQISAEDGKQVDEGSRPVQSAALDSELTLARKPGYLLDGWISNPYFLGSRTKVLPTRKEEVVWVSRLDGPSPEVVRRIIDDSIAAEARGLEGVAYFDARWQMPDRQDIAGYAYYDSSIHRAAGRVKSSGRMEVMVNDSEELFQPGEAPAAALYCGWYRLGSYLDAFDWRPGAVGYHIASGECTTLRGDTQGWCRGLLEDGAAATIGPVAEPYVQAFPVPEIFFGLLTDGYYSLAEAYFLSTPYLSWQMVLIGDPLYRPFRNARAHPASVSPAE